MTAVTALPLHRRVAGRTARDVAVLRSKAADLRSAAHESAGPLSTTYRRRAAELELEAAALAARLGFTEDLDMVA